MTRDRRPSPQTVAVLRALAQQPGTWRYGYELGSQVGLKAGSLYPILARLAGRGLLDAQWESDPPAGRPPRHLYRLNGAGLAYAARWISVDACVIREIHIGRSTERCRPAGGAPGNCAAVRRYGVTRPWGVSSRSCREEP